MTSYVLTAGTAASSLTVVRSGCRAEGQASSGDGLVGVAPHGEGVGSVERVCEGEEGEEGAGTSDQGITEREEVKKTVCLRNEDTSLIRTSFLSPRTVLHEI